MANKVISGLGWTTASSLARNIVSLLQITILTRLLAKSDFGIIAIATLFISFTTMFLDMGISVGIMYKKNTTKRIYSSLFWLNIFTGIVLTAILLVLSPLLTKPYNSDVLTNVVQLLAFTIFINSIGSQQRTICQKEFLFKRLAIIEILSAIITFGVAYSTAKMGCGVYSLAYSTLVGGLFNNIAFLTLGLSSNHGLMWHFDIKETLPFLKIGIYSIGSHILDFFSRELDIIIISATLGMEFLGVYSIAKKIPVVVYGFVNPILVKVVTPMFASINDNLQNLKKNDLLVTKCIAWYAFPMYLLIAAVAPTEMQIVFGKEYVDGAFVLSVFAIQYAFNSVNTVCGSLQTALGRTDIGLYWTIYRIVATSVVYCTTAQFGLSVFLCGMLGLIAINILAGWYMQFRPMVHVTLREYFNSFIIPFIIAALLALVLASICYKPNVVYAICSGLVFFIMYITIMLMSRERRYVLDICSHLSIQLPKKILKYLT